MTNALTYALADAFADVLRDWLNPGEFAEVRRRNALKPEEPSCASHDYCDANMAMLKAFTSTLGREPDLEGPDETKDSADVLLWNAAWSLAKLRHLSAAEGEPAPMEKMTAQYEAWVTSHGYGDFQGDAAELLMAGQLTSQEDGQWVSAFIEQWEEMEAASAKHADLYTGV